MSKTATSTRPRGNAKASTPRSEYSVRAKTLRLTPQYEAGLGLLKEVLGKPVNKMVNEAVGEYIERRTAEVEADLGNLLAQVKAYRKADPAFKQAHARLVEAEMGVVGNDPADGKLTSESPPRARSRTKTARTFIATLTGS